MFLDWKNQHCENEYTTQNNVQIQCNPYKTTTGISHRTRTKNFKICMGTQTSPKCQSNLEREKSEVREKSEREKQIPYANTYIWNLKTKMVLKNLAAGQE